MMETDMPLCYHGAISRKDCEDLMGKKNKDGAYLIRDSETIHGAMCLCVFKKRVVYTYRLLKTLSGQYTLLTAGGAQEIYFKSLDELIHHYKRKNQGLAMHLRHSVKRKTALLIRVTTQRPELRPDLRPELRPEPGQDHRSQRRANQDQFPQRESRESRAEAKHLSQPRTDQSEQEHEEVDYENLPDYVDVQPS